MLQELIQELDDNKNLSKSQFLKKFFKCDENGYGDINDDFLGITSPVLRSITKKYYDLNLNDIEFLLNSNYHEYRFVALLILKNHFEKNKLQRKTIFEFLIKNISKVNNWDLVDVFIPHIIGAYIYENPNEIKLIYDYSKSQNLWKRRISIISTFYFIRKNEFDLSLEIAQTLVYDKHDLIHKAVGWMLREIGKRDLKPLYSFLDIYASSMPRTMLRYSLEKFDVDKKRYYMTLKNANN